MLIGFWMSYNFTGFMKFQIISNIEKIEELYKEASLLQSTLIESFVSLRSVDLNLVSAAVDEEMFRQEEQRISSLPSFGIIGTDKFNARCFSARERVKNLKKVQYEKEQEISGISDKLTDSQVELIQLIMDSILIPDTFLKRVVRYLNKTGLDKKYSVDDFIRYNMYRNIDVSFVNREITIEFSFDKKSGG